MGLGIYGREITKRVKINRFGKLSYRKVVEFIRTNDIEPFNKGKRIKFKKFENLSEFLKFYNIQCNDFSFLEDNKICEFD